MSEYLIINRDDPVKNLKGPFRKVVYTFAVIDLLVVLNQVQEMTKPSKLHKWRSNILYDRFNSRDKKEEPELPEDVLEEALSNIRAKIQFSKWKLTRNGRS